MRRKRSSRKPSTATAIAIVALIFAMAGTGIAASRYIITSASQIKPSVVRELRSEIAHAAEVKLAASGAHAVVARVRSTGPVTAPPEGHPASAALKGAAWKQGPEELDEMIGFVEVSVPAESECKEAGEAPGQGFVSVGTDGAQSGPVFHASKAAVNEVVPLTTWSEQLVPGANNLNVQLTPWLYERGKASEHTLTATISDTCGVKGGIGNAHFTLKAVSVDVMGVK
jgi:hypothetical protein